jgi:hypothetical protein
MLQNSLSKMSPGTAKMGGHRDASYNENSSNTLNKATTPSDSSLPFLKNVEDEPETAIDSFRLSLSSSSRTQLTLTNQASN